jgi:hypothetical protein
MIAPLDDARLLRRYLALAKSAATSSLEHPKTHHVTASYV